MNMMNSGYKVDTRDGSIRASDVIANLLTMLPPQTISVPSIKDCDQQEPQKTSQTRRDFKQEALAIIRGVGIRVRGIAGGRRYITQNTKRRIAISFIYKPSRTKYLKNDIGINSKDPADIYIIYAQKLKQTFIVSLKELVQTGLWPRIPNEVPSKVAIPISSLKRHTLLLNEENLKLFIDDLVQ